MKRVTFLFAALAAVVMIGCTKPDDNNGKKPDTEEPNPQKEFSFTMTFNEQYKKDSVHNYSNIYINYNGEKVFIPFDITIKDTDPDKNIVYILKPVDKIDATRHQVFKKEFELTIFFDDPQFYPIPRSAIEIKEFNSKVSITPLVPGLFQLDFQLQKYDTITKKYIGDPIVTRASAFHVVQIEYFCSQEGNLRWTITDGDQQNDTYLSNYSVTERYTYEFKCGKVKRKSEFKEGDTYRIDVIEFEPQKIHNDIPDNFDITIRQHLKDGGYNDIEYKNIKTIKK